MRFPILWLLSATSLLATLPTPDQGHPEPSVFGGPASEPPLRARLTIGEETLELALDSRAELSDGRAVALELLAERTFEVPGAFAFDYPRTWHFSGGSVAPNGVDAWWTVGSEGITITLRRHAQDAAGIEAEYARNLAATGARGQRPVTLDVGGRALEGVELDVEVGGMGGYPTTGWIQQVVGFEQAPGVSWLLVLHRRVEPPELVLAAEPIEFTVDGQPFEFPLTPVLVGGSDPHAAELSAIVRGLRWL